MSSSKAAERQSFSSPTIKAESQPIVFFEKKVDTFLKQKVWGCDNPLGQAQKRRWVQKSLIEWLHTPATDAEGLATLASLKAKALESLKASGGAAYEREDAAYKKEKRERAQGETKKGGLFAFQFSQDAAACAYDVARKSGAALTGVYFADVDGIPAESLESAKAALLAMPSCFAVGVSVSGAGLAAAVAYDTEGGAVEYEYMKRVHAAVRAAAEEALHAAGLPDLCADEKAGNGVRWRFCLSQVEVKPAEELIEPLAIPAAPTPLERGAKTAKTAAKRPQGTDGAQPQGGELDADTVQKAAFAVADALIKAGFDNAPIEGALRGLYEGARPGSSRLEPGEITRMIEWTRENPRKGSRASEKAALCDAALSGWRFDVFTGRYVSPSGESTDTEGAEAAVVRWLRVQGFEVSGNYAADKLQNYVKKNPPCQIDSLTAKANALADAYTAADAGAIARTCAAWGWDAYGARRFELWLYEMMARAYTPGEKCDGMVILYGAQGTRKTSLFEAIAKEMTGSFPAQYDPQGGKDGAVRLAHTCIALIDEFDRYSRKNDVAEIKKALTQTGAVERAAYARGDSVYPYRAVFAGTTNNPQPLPPGEAQARRYWVIEVPRRMEWDTDTLRAMLRQAAHDVRDGLARGERVWVPTDAEAAEATARNSGRRGDDDSKAALAAMCAALRRAARDKKVRVETVCGALFWGNAAETGHYAQPDDAFCVVDWRAPKAQAGKISRMIAERCKRSTVWNGGNKKSGYKLADIIAEFGAE